MRTLKYKQVLCISEISQRSGWCLFKGSPEGQESKQSSDSVTGSSAAYSKNFEIPLETSLLILSQKILSNQAVHRFQKSFSPLCVKASIYALSLNWKWGSFWFPKFNSTKIEELKDHKALLLKSAASSSKKACSGHKNFLRMRKRYPPVTHVISTQQFSRGGKRVTVVYDSGV